MKFEHNYETFNKIILNTIHIYNKQAREDKMELPKILYRLDSALVVYKINNGFTKEEVEWVKSYSVNDETLKEITKKPVSFIVFSLELIRLLTSRLDAKNRPNFNINDKKLLIGRAEFFRSMLAMKKEDPESYIKKKLIIDDSVLVAQELFDYYYEMFICKEDSNGNV